MGQSDETSNACEHQQHASGRCPCRRCTLARKRREEAGILARQQGLLGWITGSEARGRRKDGPAPEEWACLTAYLARVYPEVQQGSVVATVRWLLDHLHRLETMTPPVLATLYACEQAQERVQACVDYTPNT